MSKLLQQFTIVGADVYLIISTFIFITVALAVSYRVWKMPKELVDELNHLPFN